MKNIQHNLFYIQVIYYSAVLMNWSNRSSDFFSMMNFCRNFLFLRFTISLVLNTNTILL